MKHLDAFFESVKLPSIPHVAHALIRTLNDENAGAAEVSNIIAQDPALTAQVLRIANSAQFALPRGVASVTEAVSMVGLYQVNALAIASCLNQAFTPSKHINATEFWKTSMCCAGYAKWLANHIALDGEAAWLTGLMLRLGMFLIAEKKPDLVQEIHSQALPPLLRWAREKEILGTTECEITAELARRWNFPMQIVQALHRAVSPCADQAFSRLGSVIHLAALLAESSEPAEQTIDALPCEVIDSLQLDVHWMQANVPDSSTFVTL